MHSQHYTLQMLRHIRFFSHSFWKQSWCKAQHVHGATDAAASITDWAWLIWYQVRRGSIFPIFISIHGLFQATSEASRRDFCENRTIARSWLKVNELQRLERTKRQISSSCKRFAIPFGILEAMSPSTLFFLGFSDWTTHWLSWVVSWREHFKICFPILLFEIWKWMKN